METIIDRLEAIHRALRTAPLQERRDERVADTVALCLRDLHAIAAQAHAASLSPRAGVAPDRGGRGTTSCRFPGGRAGASLAQAGRDMLRQQLGRERVGALSTFTDYLSISTNLSRYQTMTADDPTVAQATKYYQANIGSVTSAAQLVNNPRLFSYVMNAFGLSDMTYAKALIQKAMEQGTSSSKALATKLNNPNITALVNTFNFSVDGTSTTQQTAVTKDVVNKYVMQTLETNKATPIPAYNWRFISSSMRPASQMVIRSSRTQIS